MFGHLLGEKNLYVFVVLCCTRWTFPRNYAYEFDLWPIFVIDIILGVRRQGIVNDL